MFVFGYDFVHDDEPNRPPEECRPHLFRNRLMTGNIVTPLGIAHRREWIDKAGAFNELVWIDEDTDLLKRLAAGREVPLHRRRERTLPHPASSQSRTPKLTPRQEEAIQSNWRSGRPIYGVAPPGARAREIRPIAYVWPGDMPSEPAVLEGGIWLEIGLAYTEARFFRNLSISCRLSVLSWGRNHLSGWLVKIIQGGEGRESRGGIAHHALRYGRCKRLLGFSGRRSFPGSAGSIPHRVTIAHHK